MEQDVTAVVRLTEAGNGAERPLTARSVVASVLLGTRPPVLPVALIIRTTELFGISPGATRVALSRMAAAGEVEADGGRYRLAGHLVDRQARQEESRHPVLHDWGGDWLLAVVPSGRRSAADRAELRSALRRARLAELREGLWVRPANLEVVLPDTVEAWTGRPAGKPPVELWDLDGWAGRAERLLAAMEPGVDDLGDAFVRAAAVLRHLQADPLLPGPLLPADWPGDRLRGAYEDYEASFQARLREWFTAQG